MNLETELVQKLDKISIFKPSGSVEIENPTNFKLLGKGHQGAVFQIDAQRCVKIYCQVTDLDRELQGLQLGGKEGICPEVYFTGDNFIVMDYLTYPSLFEYLEKNPLSEELVARIVDLLDTFEKIGYNRFDHSARHIYITPNGKLKIIDVVHMIKLQPVLLAEKLISDLGNNAEEFLSLVKRISPKWSEIWTKHPDYPDLMMKLKAKR